MPPSETAVVVAGIPVPGVDVDEDGIVVELVLDDDGEVDDGLVEGVVDPAVGLVELLSPLGVVAAPPEGSVESGVVTATTGVSGAFVI